MGKMLFMRRLRNNKGGNVLALGALVLPVVVGFVGLGIDTIQWTLTQRQIQRVADSAAWAGAYAKAQGFDASASANDSITRSNPVVLTSNAVIENPPVSGPYKDNAAAVRVWLQTNKALPFSSLFLKSAPLIKVQATAAAITNGTYCVLSMENGNTAGITMQGSADVAMGCGLATNSQAAQAVTTGGSSTVSASPVAAVGGLKSAVNYASGTVLLPHSIPQLDPFRGLPDPSLAGIPTSCKKQLTVAPNATAKVTNPTGSSCYLGMSLKGKVNFDPGIYYVSGGALDIGSQAVVTGSNVTFILTDTYSSPKLTGVATLNINASATVNLSASTSGTYAGVLVYQDRKALDSGTNSINGNTASKLQGALYLPSQAVSFSGATGMITDCLQIVARRVTFAGKSTIKNDCPTDSGAKAFVGTRTFLVG
ncbi:MAG: hypothetical protein RLZZ84_1751 [Pseudomonadota bacterium]|jgi:hypothetical protein